MARSPLVTGFCYAGFSAVVLEAIEHGAAPMLATEAAIGVAALLVFAGVAAISRRFA